MRANAVVLRFLLLLCLAAGLLSTFANCGLLYLNVPITSSLTRAGKRVWRDGR